MHKVNTNKLEEFSWSSPKGKFAGAGREVSEALGRKPPSTDLLERHPFDVEICRLAPGADALPVSFPRHAMGILPRDFGQGCCPAQRGNDGG